VLTHGAIKTKKSQCAESQRTKCVLRISVRQMSCCRSSAGRIHSRGPATPKLLSPSLDCVRGTVYMCGHQLIWGADVLRPWRVGSGQTGTAGRGDGE